MKLAQFMLQAANKLINLGVVVTLCLTAAYAAYALWDNSLIYRAVDDVQAEMLKLKPEIGKQGPTFDELRKINPDVRAWVTLDGTKIDYPILQGKTNLTYINMDVYGKFALAGSIFLDSRNDGQFKDDYSLLYGHDMEESKMFGDLKRYKNKQFFNKNQTGTLILPDRAYDLKVYATLLIGSADERIFNPDHWQGNIEGLIAFAKAEALFINEAALKQGQQAPDKTPQILALTTCSSEFTQARTVVLAVMVPHAKAR